MGTVLIIGASGFLGAGLSRFFLSSGMRIIGVDIAPAQGDTDFSDYYQVDACGNDLRSIIEKWQPDYLVNAAGNANVGWSLANPREDFQLGPQMFLNILDSVRRYSPATKIVLMSSAAVYGQPVLLPISESDPVKPISPYGYHKWICELLAREYTELFGAQVAIMRIFSAFGRGLRKQLLWDICRKCEQGDKIILSGSGFETRDFIHIDDICKATLSIFRKGNFEGSVYNCASGTETAIKDVAAFVLESYGVDKGLLVFSGEGRKGDPLTWRADISNLKSLGFLQSVSVEKGVTDYVSWFKNDRQN